MSSPSSNTSLSLSFGNYDGIALNIPVSEFPKYTDRPLKWLRFLGFAIAGQQGRLFAGTSSADLGVEGTGTSGAGSEINDYDAPVQARTYIFKLDGVPRLIDVEALDGRTSVNSSLSSRCASFKDELVKRDERCIITGEDPYWCEAAHIIPHSKGDHYMRNLSQHRRGAYESDEELDEIDDIRNGILLIEQLHTAFGRRRCAFLRTPNFGLTSHDIPAEPGGSDRPLNRLTLQYFPGIAIARGLLRDAPHNSDAHLPDDTSQWPSTMLLDVSYAATALQAWGSSDFVGYVKKETSNIYYRTGGNPPSSDQAPEAGQGGQGGQGGSRPDQNAARALHYGARSSKIRGHTSQAEQQPDGDMLDVVLTLWKQSANEYSRKHLQDTESVESGTSERKVMEWLESMEETV